LTEPDPSGVGEDRYGGARRLARWLPFLGLLSMILASLGALAPSLGWQVSRPLMRTLQVIAAYGGIGGMLAVMRYVRGLAMRMSYSWLVRAMEVDFNTMLFSSAVMLMYWPLSGIGVITRAVRWQPLACLIAIPVLAFFGSCLSFVSHINALRKELKQEAEFARQLWPAGRAGKTPHTIAK